MRKLFEENQGDGRCCPPGGRARSPNMSPSPCPLPFSTIKSSTQYSPLTRKSYILYFATVYGLVPFIFSSRFEVVSMLARRQPDELYSLMPQFLLIIHHSLEVVFKSRIFRRYLALDSPDLLETFVVSHFGCHAQPPSCNICGVQISGHT